MVTRRPAPRKRQTKLDFSSASNPSPRKRRKIVAVSSDSSDEVDALPTRPSKRRREEHIGRDIVDSMTLSQPGRGMLGSEHNDTLVSSGSSPDDSDSEEEVPITPKKKKKAELQKKKKVVISSDEEKDTRTKRSKRRHIRQSPTPEDDTPGEQEQEPDSDSDDEMRELQEDLEFLKSSPPQDRGRLRSTQDRPKSVREMALEALKKRRAGTSGPPTSASRRKPVVLDSDSTSDLEVIHEEQKHSANEADSDDKESDTDEEARSPTTFDIFCENEEDDGFINDEDAPIGMPADAEESTLPLAFSSLGRAKARDLFKYAIDWMVQKKINPAFASGDEIYDLAFRKLDDEVNGLAKSKFHSSVWTPDFTRAIRARPDIMVNEIGKSIQALMQPHCEACNRKNHVASFEVSFFGKPYYKDTLEPLAEDSSSESEEKSGESDSESDSSSISSDGTEAALNGEKPVHDSDGNRLPPESKIFALGSICKANAQVAHTLYHWRYHLNTWVIDYLVREGHCTPEKLVERDSWSIKKRQKYAEKIMKKMEKSGEIKTLRRLYKQNVDYAVETNNDFRRGWGRR